VSSGRFVRIAQSEEVIPAERDYNWMVSFGSRFEESSTTLVAEHFMGKYAGMTVNERLFDAGMLDAFTQCIERGDDAGAVDILSKVEISARNASATVAAIRQDPSKYGFAMR
jgi:hypothetical protein